jgi:hypothetical protein
MSEWENAVVNEAWSEIWKIKVQWRNGDIGAEDAIYQIETLMDEVGE